MTHPTKHALDPASAAQLREFWCSHVDALEGHLSAKMWILAAFTSVLIVYPIGRFLIPAVLHLVVPDVVRTVLNLI